MCCLSDYILDTSCLFLKFICTRAAYLSGNIRQQQIPVITEPLLMVFCEILT